MQAEHLSAHPGAAVAAIQAQARGALLRVVALNEDVKRIAAIGHGINHRALNAMLSARRAGPQGSAFRAVIDEMRGLTRSLDSAMQELRSSAETLVFAGSQLLRLTRIVRLCAAAAQGRDAPAFAARGMQRLDEAAHALRQAEERLMAVVEEARKLAELGEVLSNMSRIEAARATQDGELARVAAELKVLIEAMLVPLKALQGHLGRRAP